MGETLRTLRKLQLVEHQLADVRRRLKRRSAAVAAGQEQIEDLQKQHGGLADEIKARQMEAGGVELELKTREEEVARLRGSLNTAKTNKEYAAVLTQINTLKADNSKLEERALRLMQAADEVQTKADEIGRQIAETQRRLDETKRTSAQEIGRLEALQAELQAQRDQAASAVPAHVLEVFNRIAQARDGDAMAAIDVIGDKPPYAYVCGGCNMSIRAEHANALQTRDELRFCDHCQRILYLEPEGMP